MELNKYYLHGIDANESDRFNIEKSISKLEQILTSGYLLSRRKLGDTNPNKGGWQGFDYISLCDYSMKDAPPYENNKFYKGYTAYETYIKTSLSLVLRKGRLKIIKPELMPPAVFGWESLQEMRYLGNHPTRRFSDFPDEVQIKHRMSLTRLEGITIPIAYMTNPKYGTPYSTQDIYDYILQIQSLLTQHDISKGIYDLETCTPLREQKDIEKVLKNS